MKIQLHNPFKSLNPFESEELEKLTIITGKNGSGKSQLVELFTLLVDENKQELELTPSVKKIQVEELPIQKFNNIDYQVWRNTILDKISYIKSIGPGIFKILDLMESAKVDYKTISENNVDEVFEQLGITENYITELGKSLFPQNHPPPVTLNILKRFFLDNKATIGMIYYAADKLKRQISNLQEVDFLKIDYPEQLISSTDLFKSSIELTFFSYLKRRQQNRIDYFHQKEDGHVNDAIPDKEFVERFPSPIQTFNRLFNTYGSKYSFEEPLMHEWNDRNPQNLKLKNLQSGAYVSPGELSSGEKIIVGLILKLFQTKYFTERLTYPDLIVLDEPDAFLHPEMSKLLIDVLYEEFVKKLDINVIFTTHSPSTIAVAPEDSVYQLKNETESGLKRITKNDALKLLTENIPTLSIDYKSHRQIFVESPTDTYYYSNVFGKIRSADSTTFNLYFISAGYGEGNSAQVISLIHALRTSGNNTTYGIIDWDSKNDPVEFIFVHAHKLRYSLENILYDPIYMVSLFIEERCSNDLKEIGFTEQYNQFEISEESTHRIDEIYKWYFSKITTRFPTLKYEDLVPNQYANGKTINIPRWYNLMQGHELEQKLKQVFPSLNSPKYISEGKLQEVLTNIICKSYPFIPKDTYDLLTNLSNK